VKRTMVALAALGLALALFAQAASARDPGGRDFGDAVFSAGVSGTDGPGVALRAGLFSLGSLVRVSDDTGVAVPLSPEELSTSGRVFLDSQTEPWVDVNPSNPSNVVGMFQEDRWSTGGARNLVFGTSFDGGATWSNIPLPGIGIVAGGEFQRVTDPWVDFGLSNRVYATSLAFDDTSPDNAIFVHTSFDGGLTWPQTAEVIRDVEFKFFNDKQALVADDFLGSPHNGNVYVAWDRLIDKSGNPFAGQFTGPAMFSRSTDGGQTFSRPQVIFGTGINEQTLGNVPIVLPDGTVVVYGSFFENPGFSAEKNHTFFYVVRSTDGGRTFSDPQIVEEQKAAPVRNIRSGDTIPIAAVDRSTGKLYAVWQDVRFSGGKRTDILLISSSDGGLTWSDPVKVNDTPPAAQDAFTPTVAVDANGRVGVLYYDLRDDNPKDPALLTAEWITFSDDGGRSWSESTRLTPPFDHRAAAFAGGFFLGDYQGLGVAGTTFIPFFGANLVAQASGMLGSDIFSTRVD
jgi:hypothetical protein